MPAKFIPSNSKLIIMPTKNCMSYLLSVMISLYTKTPSYFGNRVYKSLMKTNSDFMWNFYTIKPVPYGLYAGEKLYLPIINTINTTRYGLNSLIICRSLLLNNFPTSAKLSQSLNDFKNNLRHFRKFHCACAV